jgi:hypothetical protein
MIFLTVVAVVTSLLIVASVVSHVRARRATNMTWEELVAKIQAVESDAVATVALDHLAPTKNQLQFEPEELWKLVGGLDGLQRMKENATVLIALAVFAERWNFNEGVIVAQRMRRDGLALRRAVRAIEWGIYRQVWLNWNTTTQPFRLQEAAASYYLMKQRLLALYETSHAGLYPRLAQAL